MKLLGACSLFIALTAAGLVQAQPGSRVSGGEGMPLDISQRLSMDSVVSGRFRQSKEQAGLPAPLQSEGRFVFWRGHGVHWATESPVEQATTYRNDKTLQSSGSSGAVRELAGRRERTFRRVLLEVFSFDETQLDRQFKLQWQGDAQRWRLILRPKTLTLKRALQEVSLSGGEFVDTLRIVDAQGLTLQMDFSNQQRSHLPLDFQRCQALFFYGSEQCQQYQSR